MGRYKRVRGTLISIAVVAVTANVGIGKPAQANPLPTPSASSGNSDAAPSAEPPAEFLGALHDGPSPDVPNLTPDEVKAIKQSLKVASSKRESGPSAAYWVADYQVHYGPGAQVPSRATYRGVDTWRLTNNTYLLASPGEIQDSVCINKSLLRQQHDGNLVLYDENSVNRWSTRTGNSPGAFSRLINGQLITYAANGTVLKYTTPAGATSWNLHVQADGNVVIYAPTWVHKWSTGTSH